VTPTSQIVGTQAVLNVLSGEPYKTIAKEVANVLKGAYGQSPAAVNAKLQKRVLAGDKAIKCRPADLLKAEFEPLTADLKQIVESEKLSCGDSFEDDVLTYALFPKVGLDFLRHRAQPEFFEAPCEEGAVSEESSSPVLSQHAFGYRVVVDGHAYHVDIEAESKGEVKVDQPVAVSSSSSSDGQLLSAPLGGHVVRVLASIGQQVQNGDVVVIVEAMKMETEVRASQAGAIEQIYVAEGDSVTTGQPLLSIV